MSEARALTSTISNAVCCVVVSIWENACDRDVLRRELAANYANAEHDLDEGPADLAGPIGHAGPAH
jgi:Na+/H+-dicarboxylate symporter